MIKVKIITPMNREYVIEYPDFTGTYEEFTSYLMKIYDMSFITWPSNTEGKQIMMSEEVIKNCIIEVWNE